MQKFAKRMDKSPAQFCPAPFIASWAESRRMMSQAEDRIADEPVLNCALIALAGSNQTLKIWRHACSQFTGFCQILFKKISCFIL